MKTKFRNSILSSLRGSTILTQSVTTASMLAVAFGSTSAMALDMNALPTDGTVTGGAVTFSQSGAKLNVNQTSNRAVIDWRSFDIGEKAHVNFDQPNAASIAVNRVSASTNASQINGKLTANGQIWILNANGVMFGRTAKIDVAGLVASTAKIDARKFMAGDNRLVLSKGGSGAVVNEGQITIKEGGLAAFVAPHVRNNGFILASLGKVTLAAGETFTLDLAGDQLVEIGLGADTAKAEQLGEIIAAGGIIEISAKAAGDLVDSVINLEGMTSAASATVVGGKIILGGDQVAIAGTLDASGAEGGGEILVSGDKVTTAATASIKVDAGEAGDGGTFIAYADELGQYSGRYSAQGGEKSGNGGFIETSGKAVKIADDIRVNTLAVAGETGSWTIDPDDLTVIETGGDGSSTIGADTIVSNLEASDLVLQANESITVDAEIDSSGQTNSNTLSLNDENRDGVLTVNLNADINLGSKQSLEGEASTVNITDGADIQDGVDTAVANAQINVASGTYSEFSTRSNGPEDVTITGSDGATIMREASGDIQKVVWLRADGTTLTGFDIDGGGQHVGVAVVGEGITVSNNKIDDVLTGIQTQTAIVEGNNVFSGNTITNAVVGISLQNNSNIVTGNIISVGTKDIVVNNNFLDVPVEAFGIGSSKNTFTDNDVTIGDEGVVIKVYTTADYAALPGGIVDLLDFIDTNTLNKSVYITDGTDVIVQTIFANIVDAIDVASSGNTVNVGSGTYSLSSTLGVSKSLTLMGAGEDSTILDGSAISGYGISVSANDVSLSDFTLYGPAVDVATSYGIKVSPGGGASSRLTNFMITNVTVRGSGRAELDLNGVKGAQITNVTADGRSLADETVLTNGAGIQLTDTADVTISGSTTLGNAWGGVALYQANNYYDQQTSNINIDADDNDFQEANGLYSQDGSDSNDFGILNLSNYDYAVYNSDFRDIYGDSDQFTFYQIRQQAAVDYAISLGSTDSSLIRGWNGTTSTNAYTVGTASDGTAMSIATALNSAESGSSIEVMAGLYAEDVVDNKILVFAFEGATVNGLTLNTSGSSLQGDVTSSGNGIKFETAVVLDGDTSLTAGTAGIAVQSIDGSVAGEQALSMSTTGDLSMGALGLTTRLGTVTAAGATVSLEGSQYSANNLSYSGPVTLKQANTKFNTTQSDGSAGDITFEGNIFGSENGAQNVAFVAGFGTGDASANGSVSLQNAGTEALQLGSMTVTANNFEAATVYLEGSFTAVQTGDQTFTQQTLNVLGDVSSEIGGTFAGPVISESAVKITAGEDIESDIKAQSVNATATNGSVNGSVEATDGTATVEAATKITGEIKGTNVDVKGNEVNSAVTATETANITAVKSDSGAGTIGSDITAKNAILVADEIMSDVVVEEKVTVQAQKSYSGTVKAETAVVESDNVEADVTANTVTVTADSNFTGSVDADNAVIKSETVDVEVSGGNIKVESETGSVTGDPDNIDIVDGVVSVNNQVVLGDSDAEIKQYVVEGVELPADAYITDSGGIVLPAGLALAAISPAAEGVKPKIIMVRNVRILGELLDAGYTAIVIDLNQSNLAENQDERSLDTIHRLTDVDA